MKIEILLATYNSANYLRDLLDSLVAQSYTNWDILVHDDGSDDQTMAIFKEFEKQQGREIKILSSDKNLGPMRSFEKLLEYSSAEYIMFCDQDDVWLPHKIEESLACIQQLEQNNPDKAALVFSDLEVVDEQLNTINPSFWNYSKVNPENVYNAYKLLINNPAPGCTFIMNKKVKPLVLPFPEQARMHDWWVILKVAESGVIDYIKKPGLLYRQHKKNKVGAEPIKNTYLLSRMANLSLTVKRNKESYQMMKCLSNDYSLLKLFWYKLRISLTKLL
ncbi:glycosyltransferase family 2 protein [uncultured Draconibacterium sp.]|uniref:glycosyltransferase family 2 protein n=1 Tax=uncultured Draconibacterium sp. TaxID=1573823 RepID=UPI0029C6DDA4|nr:glycosyltransferase family 2 protein [uncultured Draconibacterium sp.]